MKWITLQHFAADELSQLWANHGCDHGHTAGGLTSNSSSRVNQSEDEHRAKKLSLQATVLCRLRLEAEPGVEVVLSWKSRRTAAAVMVLAVAVGSVVVVLLVVAVAAAVGFAHTCSSWRFAWREQHVVMWLSRWLLPVIHHWNRRWLKRRRGHSMKSEISGWQMVPLRPRRGGVCAALRPQQDEHLWRSSN